MLNPQAEATRNPDGGGASEGSTDEPNWRCLANTNGTWSRFSGQQPLRSVQRSLPGLFYPPNAARCAAYLGNVCLGVRHGGRRLGLGYSQTETQHHVSPPLSLY